VATNYKVLGQSAPSATTATTLYTVPASTQAVVSTIFVCNRGGSAATFRIAVRPGGASLANQHYLFYDVNVDANSILPVTTGITLDATDVLTIYAANTSFSFSAFGSEITA
jgi:glucose-6-phosphate dehydrogenase assembly protein OpcA